MRLCLAEDIAAAQLEPLTLTRPVHELWLGCSTLGAKIARAFGIGEGPQRRGAVIRGHLKAVQSRRDPHVVLNDPDWLARGPLVVVNSRWVPPARFEAPGLAAPCVGFCEGEPAFAVVAPDDAASTLTSHGMGAWFDRMAERHPGSDVGGEWIRRPWDLVARNAAHIERDFEVAGRRGVTNRQLATLALVGPSDRLRIHETARIDPYTVFDTTNGPIVVEPNVWVQPFTRVEGPCYIGAETQLFRANIRGAVSIGSNCRIGGEVEASIIQGYSNKYHEGFLGHAYIGEWVNLGAITSNSDLRNDYGEVCVPLQGDPVPTGQAKVGCFVGDHTRTGMGSMLNTGTAIGVMCNVLPAGLLLPKHVPSFTAVLYGRVGPGFSLDQMFETAKIVMSRRGKTFGEAEEQLYRGLYEQTRLERERAFQRSHDRRADFWPVAQAGRM
ncbi:Bacterial transferase hexapeptide (six repeats) [Aquisphaera giovannonii]|uniref:Bacterial transferase hexapeptide (Six repeats) n=1 Tax=Aquisphaera giovannonii TaxID=406548 RepID=A0A5B9W6W9_9BACT|nr:putative sugar nucleotidyl transferase [Aquisphaera giovannonii]QEH36087.1 Bacterial transferase hexapeptide (six repeats) [Aquisphaera giovannonii]